VKKLLFLIVKYANLSRSCSCMSSRRSSCIVKLARTELKVVRFPRAVVWKNQAPVRMALLIRERRQKIINNYSFERVLNVAVNHCLSLEQQETIKWSCTFAGHCVTKFKEHCCKTEVFNNTVINNWKVNAARTEKKLLENRNTNNYMRYSWTSIIRTRWDHTK